MGAELRGSGGRGEPGGRPGLRPGSQACRCVAPAHRHVRVALTGGPGAGKTAVLEMATRIFCGHVVILPESASIVFGGGFPRIASPPGRRCAQRAIFHIQRQLEGLAEESDGFAVALCDRGTLDGAAYWPGPPETYWSSVGTSREEELARYAAVVHLSTPSAAQGYNHDNHLRTEEAEEAIAIDHRIAEAWAGHPARVVIPAGLDFAEKALAALARLRDALPPCCRGGAPAASHP